MKIQEREMLAECGRKKWGPELRWRDWLYQLFCCDKRDIGRVGYLDRCVCIWRGRVREQSGRDERIKIAGLTIKIVLGA